MDTKSDSMRLALDLGDRAGSILVAVNGERAALILDEAARRARHVAAGVVISTHLDVGGTAATILRAGREDTLIVVGRGRNTPLALRSTDWRVARRARGPLAIVELDDQRRTGRSAGRVVLGIDDAAGPPSAVAYAFHAASRRGVGLTVVQACGGGRIVDDLRKLVTVDDALQLCSDAFPDVDVRRRFVAHPVGPALVAESHAAALLVIGARSPGPVHRPRLGSVARSALRSARSPIAIVPPSSSEHDRPLSCSISRHEIRRMET